MTIIIIVYLLIALFFAIKYLYEILFILKEIPSIKIRKEHLLLKMNILILIWPLNIVVDSRANLLKRIRKNV